MLCFASKSLIVKTTNGDPLCIIETIILIQLYVVGANLNRIHYQTNIQNTCMQIIYRIKSMHHHIVSSIFFVSSSFDLFHYIFVFRCESTWCVNVNIVLFFSYNIEERKSLLNEKPIYNLAFEYLYGGNWEGMLAYIRSQQLEKKRSNKKKQNIE